MNRTRLNIIRPARRLVTGLLLMFTGLMAAPAAAVAGNPSDSAYFGEPMISAEGPLMLGDGYSASGPASFNAPTLRVGGAGGNSADLDRYFQVPGGGYGVEGRIGHVGGQTVGRTDSLTHVNLQPYMFVEETMLFGDFRMYRMNDGQIGGNLGGGWRRYFADHDAILTAVGYYDVDDSRTQRFQQMGLSLEMLSRWLDVRANWYIPIGQKEQILGTNFINGSQQFMGNLLLVDTITSVANSAEGVDVTFTSPVPWEKLQPYNVEASAGFYNFQVRDEKLPSLWGYRLRADASFFDRMLHTFVELTNDRQHKTSVIIGASLDYYGGFESGNRLKDRQYYRMSEWVRRNYNVVTVDSDVITEDVPVINPLDGASYIFVHIANNPVVPGVMDGTFEAPADDINGAFDMITTGIDENGDVQAVDAYFVQGGSLFTGDDATLVVPDNKILIGEPAGIINDRGVLVPSIAQTLPAVLGSRTRDLELPSTPRLQEGVGVSLVDASGTAIDGSNALLVASLTIVNPAEHGLLVAGQSSVLNPPFFTTASTSQLYRDLTILGADGDGVFFNDASGAGDYVLERVNVRADDTFNGVTRNGSLGVALHVLEGTARIRVRDLLPTDLTPPDIFTEPTFENSAIRDANGNVLFNNESEIVLIENTEGGLVDLKLATINDHGDSFVNGLFEGGGGIRLLGNMATIELGEAIIENTTMTAGVGAGLEITDGAGIATLFSDVTIINPSGVGFLVDSLLPTGTVNVNDLQAVTVDNRNDIGAYFTNVMGTVFFSPTVANVAGSSLTISPTTSLTNAPAVKFDSSTGTVSLNNVSIDGSLTEGILIGDPNLMALQNIVTFDPVTGAEIRPRFFATGTTNITNTGSLANLGTAAIRIEGVPINSLTNPFGEAADAVFSGTVQIDQRVDRGIQIINTSGDIRFSGTTNVLNTSNSARAALHIRNMISRVNFNVFLSDSTIPGEPAVEIQDVPAPGSVGFTNLRIQNAQGDGADTPAGDGDPTLGNPTDITGLFVRFVNSFDTVDGSIFVNNGIAVDIEHVYPQNELRQWLVRDSQNRTVVIDSVGGAINITPFGTTPANFLLEPDNPQDGYIVQGVLDIDGNFILDSGGANVIPPLDGLQAFPAYDVNLTDVSSVTTNAANAPLFGIFLEDNVGQFTVSGVSGIPETGNGMPDSGGEITQARLAGTFANDADQVILQWQFYNGNLRGLDFINMNENTDQGAFLFANQIQNSPFEAFRALNLRNVGITGDDVVMFEFLNNNFANISTNANTTRFTDTIAITVSELPNDRFDPADDGNPSAFPYSYSIVNNDFNDLVRTLGADGARIATVPAAARGARLLLNFNGNNFLQFDRVRNQSGGALANTASANLLSVLWEGEILANVNQNTANLTAIVPQITAGNRQGFEFLQTSSDHDSAITLSDNILFFENAVNSNGTGAVFNFLGTATINATFNEFDLFTGGTGLQFSLLDQFNTVTINGNIFDFATVQNNPLVGSGIGVNVLQLLGPSTFIINNNAIGLNGAANVGFRFRHSGILNLIGPVQNDVFAVDFFDPDNDPNIIGQININGNFVP